MFNIFAFVFFSLFIIVGLTSCSAKVEFSFGQESKANQHECKAALHSTTENVLHDVDPDYLDC